MSFLSGTTNDQLWYYLIHGTDEDVDDEELRLQTEGKPKRAQLSEYKANSIVSVTLAHRQQYKKMVAYIQKRYDPHFDPSNVDNFILTTTDEHKQNDDNNDSNPPQSSLAAIDPNKQLWIAEPTMKKVSGPSNAKFKEIASETADLLKDKNVFARSRDDDIDVSYLNSILLNLQSLPSNISPTSLRIVESKAIIKSTSPKKSKQEKKRKETKKKGKKDKQFHFKYDDAIIAQLATFNPSKLEKKNFYMEKYKELALAKNIEQSTLSKLNADNLCKRVQIFKKDKEKNHNNDSNKNKKHRKNNMNMNMNNNSNNNNYGGNKNKNQSNNYNNNQYQNQHQMNAHQKPMEQPVSQPYGNNQKADPFANMQYQRDFTNDGRPKQGKYQDDLRKDGMGDVNMYPPSTSKAEQESVTGSDSMNLDMKGNKFEDQGEICTDNNNTFNVGGNNVDNNISGSIASANDHLINDNEL